MYSEKYFGYRRLFNINSSTFVDQSNSGEEHRSIVWAL